MKGMQMKKIVIAIMLFVMVGCTTITPPAPISITATPVIPTPTMPSIPTSKAEEWSVIKSMGTTAAPVQKNNPGKDWTQFVLAEDVRFSSRLQIRMNMESTGTNGILLIATPAGDYTPGVDWWKGHKRLEVFYNGETLSILLRDGTQQDPVYSKEIPFHLNNGDMILDLDAQAKNIRIQQDDKTLLEIYTPATGDYPIGLFPEGRILDIELSNAPNSNAALTRFEILIPTAEYLSLPPASTPASGLPGPIIPDGLAVGIHFLAGQPWELDAIQEAGFHFIHVDAYWNEVEREKGVYDFSETDVLIESALKRNLRILFTFSCCSSEDPRHPLKGHPLYDNGISPYTKEGQAAFAQFASALVKRYAGQGILWTLWGEANGDGLWSPQEYAQLSLATIKAIRNADPTAIIVGPDILGIGTESQSTWSYYDQLGQLGVLKEYYAIGIDPYDYPFSKPEEIGKFYGKLRTRLQKYVPDHQIPIVIAEYGYSTSWPGVDDERQAEYLTRLWLINQANHVYLSNWYDWKDDGPDKKDAEDNFGIKDIYGNPKISYTAARTFIQTLEGYQFDRRISTPNENDYLLLFKKGGQSILAAWTATSNHSLLLPLSGNSLETLSMVGETGGLRAGPAGFEIMLTGSPQYIPLGTQTLP